MRFSDATVPAMRHLPNALTIARIAITPVLLGLLLSETLLGQFWAFGLFVAAAVSDYLDGKLARSYQVRSRLGQFLDPFADKILVLGTFACLAYLIPAVVPWWAVVLIALRDVGVTVLRSWAEAHGRSLRTTPVARAKTLVQLIYLILLLLLLACTKAPGALGRGAGAVLEGPVPFLVLLFVVGFTVVTGLLYAFRQEYTPPSQFHG